MKELTIADYLGKYATHPDASTAIRGTAARMLDKVNAALLLAELDGVVLHVNPVTGSHLGGTGNGGFRPMDCPIGAPSSKHKSGEGIDIYDPKRELAAWSIANAERLQAAGILAMERPEWTPSWTHWQVVAVKSGNFAFIPNNDPPLAAAPAPWVAGGRALA